MLKIAWKIVQIAGILGGFIGLILLCKQYLLSYWVRLYYCRKIDRFLEIFFDPSTMKVGERTLPIIAFSNPGGEVNDDHFFELRKKYRLTIGKTSLHFPLEVFVKSNSKEWSYPDLREKGYLTFDCFPRDHRPKQSEVLQPGDVLALGTVGFQLEVAKTGEYEIPASAELLLETRIGHVKLVIQRKPRIEIITANG